MRKIKELSPEEFRSYRPWIVNIASSQTDPGALILTVEDPISGHGLISCVIPVRDFVSQVNIAFGVFRE